MHYRGEESVAVEAYEAENWDFFMLKTIFFLFLF